jgi:ketosteroid isomerase-like protein
VVIPRVDQDEERSQAMSEDLARRVQALEDEAEIRRLVTSYSVGADLAKADAFASLFAEDAVVKIIFTGPGGPEPEVTVYSGRDEIKTFVTGSVNMSINGRSHHHQAGQLEVHVHGDDADGFSYSFTIVREDAGLIIKAANFRRWTFKRIDGRWFIASIDVTPLGSSGIDQLFSAMPVLNR